MEASLVTIYVYRTDKASIFHETGKGKLRYHARFREIYF